MMGFVEISKRLKILKCKGYVKTHRTGNTGVGKTLEDFLGITENNIPGPNGHKMELKSARKNAKSMLTLFTKSPLPPKANASLLRKFGYESQKGNKKKELHTTINAKAFNNLRDKIGFKIEVKNKKVLIINKKKKILGYWDEETLKKSFERKLPRLLYVKAESRGKEVDEEFWYNEAWLLKGFSFKNFIKLLREGTILIDIRIGQYPDGRTHDHGTGFRVLPIKLDLCFSDRRKII